MTRLAAAARAGLIVVLFALSTAAPNSAAGSLGVHEAEDALSLLALSTAASAGAADRLAKEARNLGRASPGVHEDSQGLLELAKPTALTATAVFAQFSAPVQIASDGADLLAQEAETGAVAVERVVLASAQGARTRNATQVAAAVAAAIADAQSKAVEIYAATSPQASASAAMIGAVVIVAVIWAFEFALGKDSEGRPKEDPGSARGGSAHHELQEGLRSPRFLNALGFARYLAALHVVLANYWLRPDLQPLVTEGDTWEVFARWGVLSAPFFFVLSGFCSTYWKLVGPLRACDEDDIWAMFRKARAWYPVYAIALTWCAVRLLSNRAEDWSHYLASMALINGVLWAGDQYPYLNGGWWLCYLMVYLLTWSSTYRVLYDSVYPRRGSSASDNEARRKILWTVFVACWGACVPLSLLEWHVFGDSAFFALIQYWPSFIFGQALAFWLVLRCMRPTRADASRAPESVPDDDVLLMVEARDIPALVRFGPSIAYLALAAQYFTYSPYDAAPFIFHGHPVTPLILKGGLLPVFGILVLGLACEADPVAKFFARRPLRWLDRLAFATFALQVPVHNSVQDVYGLTGVNWTFSACLFSASILAHVLVEQPWRAYLELRPK